MINPCGVYCKDCSWYKKGCEGCRETKGIPFWAVEHTEKGVCPIWDCAVNSRDLNHCGECSLLPCKIFTDLRDPSMTDEQYETALRERIEALKNIQG